MRRGVTGQYVVNVSSGETVRAFVPDPLPPDPPLDLTGARQRRLEQALLACGRLDAITALLPEPDIFLYT
ncbi:MAG: Fic family protein, partial [Coriobacteriales bacterium]